MPSHYQTTSLHISNPSQEQQKEPNEMEDEQFIDFGNTGSFAARRWNELFQLQSSNLSAADLRDASKWSHPQDLSAEIRSKISDRNVITRRLIGQIQPVPQTFRTFVDTFSKLVKPNNIDSSLLWGLFGLIVRSSNSPERLSRTVGSLTKLRRAVDLFNRCLNVSGVPHEGSLLVVEVLEAILSILVSLCQHLRADMKGADAVRDWPTLDLKIAAQLSRLDEITQHLNDISTITQSTVTRHRNALVARYAIMPEHVEYITFPFLIVPRRWNRYFYGRHEELTNIDHYLNWTKNPLPLRTYTLYGRRGVGKTEIALEYAHSNPASYDAIFWIGCDTAISIRQSFSDAAIALKLPGADRSGHHEENLLAMQKWLRLTKKRWLMIFDNADQESILEGYWPREANGAVLITSRKWYNFMKTGDRSGSTINPFDKNQSLDLCVNFLGPDWRDLYIRKLLKVSEVTAMEQFLALLEGLPQAIVQAAILIKDERIGGPRVETTLEMFNYMMTQLPERQVSPRSDAFHKLDTLWYMTFKMLSRNASYLLSVFDFLSLDIVPLGLFLPHNQDALDGKLAFCKRVVNVDGPQGVSSGFVDPTPELRNALDELASREILKQDGRILAVHRVIRDAINHHSKDDLQDSFNSAVSLVYEAFPKRTHENSLHQDWAACEMLISHATWISEKFSEYTRPTIEPRLKASHKFIQLLENASWYLYEISDYKACLKMAKVASSAYNDKETLLYANISCVTGLVFYDLNNLVESRKSLETTLHLCETLLPLDDIQTATILNNIGYLETASGHISKALEYFRRASKICLDIRDGAASQLALSFLGMGRTLCLAGNYTEAAQAVGKSEAISIRLSTFSKAVIAQIYYAYGNIEYKQKHWEEALAWYNKSLNIGTAYIPIAPITIAAYFKAGCVEFQSKRYESAKLHLDKARAIAELRSPSRDDGTIARILWKTAQVLRYDDHSVVAAARYLKRAEIARRTLMASGEGGVMQVFKEAEGFSMEEQEAAYDLLVPGSYR